MTDFEISDKPLQADDRNDEDELVELVTRETEELKQILIERIDKMYKDHQEKLVDFIGRIGDLQQQGRNVLSLIHNFKQLCVLSAQLKTNRDFVTSWSFPNKDQATAELEKHFQIFKQTILVNLPNLVNSSNLAINYMDHSREKKAMKLWNPNSGSDVKNDMFEFYSSVGDSFTDPLCYRLILSAEVLLIQKTNEPILDGRIESGIQIASRPFRKLVKKFFFHTDMSKIIIQRDDACFDMLSAETRYEVKNFDLEIKNGLLCPYFVDKKVHQCYWNAEEEAICLTHTEKKFDCESCPKLISSEIHPVMCFLTTKNDFIAYDLVAYYFIYVPFIMHGCDSIDYVTTFGSVTNSLNRLFFFWSIK